MRRLGKVATEAQKARWLQPIVDGKLRSAFAMTEPAPGAGSDPGLMLSRAERDGDAWVLNGPKWFLPGAGVAEPFIAGARPSDATRQGPPPFLFPPTTPVPERGRRTP